MKIKARIDRMVNGSTIKAIASASFDSQFVVRNLRVVDGKKGLFVAYPQESYPGQGGATKYSNLFFPISNAGKMDLEKAVLDAYHQQLNQSQSQSYGGQQGQYQGYEGYQGYQGYPYPPQDYPRDFDPITEDDGMLPFNM